MSGSASSQSQERHPEPPTQEGLPHYRGGEDDDVQMIGESVVIREEDETGKMEGLRTPKGRDRGDRTPTGFTPDQKRSRLEEGAEEEEQERGTETRGGEEGNERNGGPSGSHQTQIPPAQVGVEEEQKRYQGTPISPPPGLQTPLFPGDSGPQPENPLQAILQDFASKMEKGFLDVGAQVQQIRTDINRDLGKVRAEQRETKEIATKALTVADTTQKEVQSLAKRVAVLEKGKPHTGGTRATSANTTPAELGYNALGGERGTDMVLGEFDEYASREERKENWEIIKEHFRRISQNKSKKQRRRDCEIGL